MHQKKYHTYLDPRGHARADAGCSKNCTSREVGERTTRHTNNHTHMWEQNTDLACSCCRKASWTPLLLFPSILSLLSEIFCITVAPTYDGRKGKEKKLVVGKGMYISSILLFQLHVVRSLIFTTLFWITVALHPSTDEKENKHLERVATEDAAHTFVNGLANAGPSMWAPFVSFKWPSTYSWHRCGERTTWVQAAAKQAAPHTHLCCKWVQNVCHPTTKVNTL